MTITKVHLDTDLGGDSDDLCALAWLLRRPDVDVIAITTNADVDGARVDIIHESLRLAGSSGIPVRHGAGGSIRGYEMEVNLHDPDRFWPPDVAERLRRASDNPRVDAGPGAAIDELTRSIDAGAIIVGIGPWTNLGILEVLRPGTLRRANLVLMGGSVRPMLPGYPDWGWEYDYNVQQDAEAARIVLEAGDPLIVPVEVTVQFPLTRRDAESLQAGDRLCAVLAAQAVAYAVDNDHAGLVRANPGLPDDLLNFQHDALACMAAIGVEGITIESIGLSISEERGMLRMTPADTGRPYRVVTGTDSTLLRQTWLDTVLRAVLTAR